MNAYSYSKDNNNFDDAIFEILLDKTKGNIRETFRYLSDFLKCQEYNTNNLIETIKRIDEMKLKVLNEADKNIIRVLAGKTYDIKEIQNNFESEHGKIMSSVTLRIRLDQLNQIGLVFKTREPQSKKIIYSAATVLKEILQQ